MHGVAKLEIVFEREEEAFARVIKFEMDRKLSFREAEKLFSCLDEEERKNASLVAERCVTQYCGTFNPFEDASGYVVCYSPYVGRYKAKESVFYVFKFRGDEKTVDKVFKKLQEVFPEHFIGLEKENGAAGI